MVRTWILAIATTVVLVTSACDSMDDGAEQPDAEDAELTTLELEVGARICNGSAPMRYYNPESCCGTVQRYIAPGTRGWYQTAGGCGGYGCGDSMDYYFHPSDGSHGGWVPARHLCPL
jgi:hypothetical protein